MNIGQEITFYQERLAIDDSNINQELAQYSAMYYSVLQLANLCEEAFDKTEAYVDTSVRDEARVAEEKVTEKVVESRVKSSLIFQSTLSQRNATRALKEAYKSKGNMLIQIATNMREEMKNLNHSFPVERPPVQQDDVNPYAKYL